MDVNRGDEITYLRKIEATKDHILKYIFKEKCPPLTYCVFEIDGRVRVVKNKLDEHVEVEVIEILKENLKVLLDGKKTIKLYMNNSPCSSEGYECAEMIREHKSVWDQYATYFFKDCEEHFLKLEIAYANFYTKENEDEENNEGLKKLKKLKVKCKEFETKHWNELENLLTKWEEYPKKKDKSQKKN